MSEWTRVVEGSAGDLADLVGRQVELVGVLARTKIPALCGVDVADPEDLAGQRVRARGTLRRRVIGASAPEAPVAAGRGPGVYYSLRNAAGALAGTEPWAGS